MNSDDGKFLAMQAKWIFISLAISIAISFVVPFPFSIMVIIPVFLAISMVIRRRAMQQAGMTSGPGFFGSKGLDYYCMACGHKHRKATCPKCGSRMKKAGF